MGVNLRLSYILFKNHGMLIVDFYHGENQNMLRVMSTLLLILIGLLPSAAQAEATVVNLGGGYFAELPEGWEIVTNGDDFIYPVDEALEPTYLVSENGTEAVIVSPDSLKAAFADAGKIRLEEAFEIARLAVYGADSSEPNLLALPLDDHDAVVDIYIDERATNSIRGGMYVLNVNNEGRYLLANVYGENSNESLPETMMILKSITFDPNSVEAENSDSQASGEPCLVSTQTARTATVRVGPGENRTALLFLPVGNEFTVTGRIVLDDETVWYQLDKTQVDPNTSASELWVAQSLVDEVGDCALVGETSAPPIRPIMSAPPATGGNNSGGGGGSAPAGSLPQSGTWTMTLGSRGLVSCLGTNTVEFNTSQVYGSDLSDTYNLTANPSTDSFVMGGQAFTRLPSGAFTGALSFNNGSVGINFYVQNTGFMSGELVYNENIQGLQCSFTIPLSASRN